MKIYDYKNSLYFKLIEYSKCNKCPMHMPGHKRQNKISGVRLPYKIDITEITDFDNLHKPCGILKDTSVMIANLYNSAKSYMLINGSTGGILAGISACTKPNDKILIARNCHKSVYNAVEINSLQPIYILPETDNDTMINGSISPKQVEEMIKTNNDIKLIVITSPTYEGVISDIKSIASIAHKYMIPLLVDEAHGAHLYYKTNSAVNYGADIVINSLHKTLPSLTQTAIAHINGNLVSCDKFEQKLALYESSSPSYILMASIDSCIRLLKNNGDKLFKKFYNNLQYFELKIRDLKYLQILNYGNLKKHTAFYDFDRSKIVISTLNTKFSGTQLFNMLRDEYHIELEMAYNTYALAMTTIFDSKKTLTKLANALISIDSKMLENKNICAKTENFSLPEKIYNIGEVINKSGQFVKFEEALNKISLEYVWAYPPGIPLIVPGEIINKAFILKVKQLNDSGITINSTFNQMPINIMVLNDKIH